jgi:hypothetical protein
MAVLDVIVPRLVPLPGVVAVVLAGSRARGTDAGLGGPNEIIGRSADDPEGQCGR